jgi:hypothetical protein
MKRQAVLCITVLLGLLAAPRSQAIQPCSDEGTCASVSIDGQIGVSPGATVTIPFSFAQGQGNGIGQIAAIAFTVMMPNGLTPPLTLSTAGCTPSGSDADLPSAVQPSELLSQSPGYKLVIENAYCSESRTHCLCPTDSTVPDNFINVVIYGPNPLPTTGPVDIPALPTGQLFTIALQLGSTVGGNIPLHVLNQVTDSPSTRPPFTALLSVGDLKAVDQTCSYVTPPSECPPPTGQCPLPCSDPSSNSQVVIHDGNVLVSGGCNGSCDYSGQVTVNDILKMVNIALGNDGVASCPAGDINADSQITVDEILGAVNKALSGCS